MEKDLKLIQASVIKQIEDVCTLEGIILEGIVTFTYTDSIFLKVGYKTKQRIVEILHKSNICTISNTDERMIIVNPYGNVTASFQLPKVTEKKETKKYKKPKQTNQLKLFDNS